VPSGIAKYANPVPLNKTLPASFFLSAKPSWWPSAIAWPPIGPDVSGGSLAGLAGHAHQIPACNCYANVMNGPADGSGAPLSFNADSCYGSLSAVSVNVLQRCGLASFSILRAASGREWIITVQGASASASSPVCVYDLRGRLKRALFPNRASQGYFTYFWDGTDNQGQSLTKGVYVIRGKAAEDGKIMTMF
jgi:hypothetical protein